MHLKRENAFLCALFILIRHIDGFFSVNEMLQVVSLSDDHVVIPFCDVDGVLNFLGNSYRASHLNDVLCRIVGKNLLMGVVLGNGQTIRHTLR